MHESSWGSSPEHGNLYSLEVYDWSWQLLYKLGWLNVGGGVFELAWVRDDPHKWVGWLEHLWKWSV
jgi:hypothetical protein